VGAVSAPELYEDPRGDLLRQCLKEFPAPSPASIGSLVLGTVAVAVGALVVRATNVASPVEGEGTMYVVIRSYSGRGASELFDALVESEEDVKNIISTVPGFISYEAFRSDGGGQTVTVCEGKAGTDESSRRAAEWVKDNIGVTVDPPTITEGSTILHF
jgi:hypothetical protein